MGFVNLFGKDLKVSSSLNTDRSLCVAKVGILPYDPRFGRDAKDESCKDRGYCQNPAPLVAAANPFYARAKGGCTI